MIDRFTDRLSEYLDGDLDARDEALIEAHLVGCATCRATLAELRAVVARAVALPATEPETDLWDGIRSRIEEERPAVTAPAAGARRRLSFRSPLFGGARSADQQARTPRRVSLSWPQLAAAAVVLVAVSGGAVWLATGAGRGEPFDRTAVSSAPTRTRLDGVEDRALPYFVTNEHRATIMKLEEALAQRRDALDPVTIAVLESNLRIIDAAIAEAVAALEREPGNAYLNRHLGNTVEKKIDVLRRAAGAARTEI